MTDPSTILELDKARREAMVRADVSALGDLFADDLAWIHGNGVVDTKEGIIGKIGSGKSKYLSIESSDETVRFLGGLALLTAITTQSVEMGGEVRNMQNRYTIVWAPDGDDWKVVNWQSTAIPKAA